MSAGWNEESEASIHTSISWFKKLLMLLSVTGVHSGLNQKYPFSSCPGLPDFLSLFPHSSTFQQEGRDPPPDIHQLNLHILVFCLATEKISYIYVRYIYIFQYGCDCWAPVFNVRAATNIQRGTRWLWMHYKLGACRFEWLVNLTNWEGRTKKIITVMGGVESNVWLSAFNAIGTINPS